MQRPVIANIRNALHVGVCLPNDAVTENPATLGVPDEIIYRALINALPGYVYVNSSRRNVDRITVCLHDYSWSNQVSSHSVQPFRSSFSLSLSFSLTMDNEDTSVTGRLCAQT